MEELWKRHKKEIRNHLSNVEGFLRSEIETSKPIEISPINETEKMRKDVQQIQNIVIEETSKKRGRPKSKRRQIYGKLRDIVKDLIENEGLSRAQAYRKAKKMHMSQKEE